MQQIAPNTYVETRFPGCNSTFVKTTEGVVLIDTPERPVDSLSWRDVIRDYGTIKYLINTEPHGDHYSGNCYFEGTVVSQEGVRDAILKMPLETAKAHLKGVGKGNEAFLKDYYLRPPTITFSTSLDLYLGKHTFHLVHLPGHSPYQIAVYIPEEKVICTSDNVVYKVQPSLHQALPYEWVDSLNRIEAWGENTLVPGHGEICQSDYIQEMRNTIQSWINAVRSAIQKGLSLTQAMDMISFADQYPMPPDHFLTLEELQRENVEHLYKILSTFKD